MSSVVPPVNIQLLESYFEHMRRIGMPYGLGAKLSLSIEPDDIKPGTAVDCSGFARYILHWATNRQLTLPDGSQNQREWAENNLRKIAKYSDANTYLTESRLFLAFIRPWENGARGIGHVWLVGQFDTDQPADTMESYGGVGVGSRNWDARVLRQQVYATYALSTV